MSPKMSSKIKHSFKLCQERPDLCESWGCKCKCHKVSSKIKWEIDGEVHTRLKGEKYFTEVNGNKFLEKALKAQREETIRDFVNKVCNKYLYAGEYLPKEAKRFLDKLKGGNKE